MSKSKCSIKHLWCFTVVYEFMKYMFNSQNTSLQQFHWVKNHHTNTVSRNTPRFQWVKGTQKTFKPLSTSVSPGPVQRWVQGWCQSSSPLAPRDALHNTEVIIGQLDRVFWEVKLTSWCLTPIKTVQPHLKTNRNRKEKENFGKMFAKKCWPTLQIFNCYLPIPPQSHHQSHLNCTENSCHY